jgi:hypothetical protein
VCSIAWRVSALGSATGSGTTSPAITFASHRSRSAIRRQCRHASTPNRFGETTWSRSLTCPTVANPEPGNRSRIAARSGGSIVASSVT